MTGLIGLLLPPLRGSWLIGIPIILFPALGALWWGSDEDRSEVSDGVLKGAFFGALFVAGLVLFSFVTGK